MTPEEWQAYKRRQYCRERRDERFRVKLALETINSDAADAFYRNIDANLFPWSSFFREVVKAPPRMSADIQTVLLGRWVEHKSIASHCDHSPITALRMLLPSYDGPAMRLFRGQELPSMKRVAISFRGHRISPKRKISLTISHSCRVEASFSKP